MPIEAEGYTIYLLCDTLAGDPDEAREKGCARDEEVYGETRAIAIRRARESGRWIIGRRRHGKPAPALCYRCVAALRASRKEEQGG